MRLAFLVAMGDPRCASGSRWYAKCRRVIGGPYARARSMPVSRVLHRAFGRLEGGDGRALLLVLVVAASLDQRRQLSRHRFELLDPRAQHLVLALGDRAHLGAVA